MRHCGAGLSRARAPDSHKNELSKRGSGLSLALAQVSAGVRVKFLERNRFQPQPLKFPLDFQGNSVESLLSSLLRLEKAGIECVILAGSSLFTLSVGPDTDF